MAWETPIAQQVKNLLAMQEMWVQSLGQEDALEEGLATHSSILAWRIPRAEEPAAAKSLQSCLTLCDPVDCSPPGSSVHGDCPDKNTGVGCQTLLQGIFPTQGSNPYLLYLLRWLLHPTKVE